MGKNLKYKMLTDQEKAEYMTLVNVANWAERADKYDEASMNFPKAVMTGGMSIIYKKSLALFTAIRGEAGDVSRREAIAKFLVRVARKHGCTGIDRSKFPAVERWGFGFLEGIEPVDDLIFHSQIG